MSEELVSIPRQAQALDNKRVLGAQSWCLTHLGPGGGWGESVSCSASELAHIFRLPCAASAWALHTRIPQGLMDSVSASPFQVQVLLYFLQLETIPTPDSKRQSILFSTEV